MNKRLQPAQKQERQPGREAEMRPQPDYEPKYAGCGRLNDKVALITGGDSGIGRAVAVAMAREGAKIAIVYLEEHKDADETVAAIEQEGSRAIKVAGDIGDEKLCRDAVEKTVREFGRFDILVNNAAEQHETEDVREIDARQIERTFRTNVFSFFFMTKHALRHMKKGGLRHQHHIGHCLPRPQDFDRLCCHQGCDRGFDAFAVRGAGQGGHPRQRGCARADLDAAHSSLVRSRTCGQAWWECSHETCGTAQRGRALLRVPGKRGRLLYERPSAASERRQRGGLVTAGTIGSCRGF